MKKITNELIIKFKNYLINEEKSQATVEKYIRDITTFAKWLNGRSIDKSVVIEYKHTIVEAYAPTSANSMLSSINSFFAYMEWYDCKVKALQPKCNKRKEGR